MTERSKEELLEALDSIRSEWLRWSSERLEEEAAEVLNLEKPVPVEELSRDQVLRLIVEWEPIHDTREA